MSDELGAKFPATTDARVWAEEFCKKFNGYIIQSDEWKRFGAVDMDTMLAWFATAIEVGKQKGMSIDYDPQFGEEE